VSPTSVSAGQGLYSRPGVPAGPTVLQGQPVTTVTETDGNGDIWP